jgi:hypothetical protein
LLTQQKPFRKKIRRGVSLSSKETKKEITTMVEELFNLRDTLFQTKRKVIIVGMVTSDLETLWNDKIIIIKRPLISKNGNLTTLKVHW